MRPVFSVHFSNSLSLIFRNVSSHLLLNLVSVVGSELHLCPFQRVYVSMERFPLNAGVSFQVYAVRVFFHVHHRIEAIKIRL